MTLRVVTGKAAKKASKVEAQKVDMARRKDGKKGKAICIHKVLRDSRLDRGISSRAVLPTNSFPELNAT